MTFDQLKDKALKLPLSPGVYIMRDGRNTVIYVGKAKKLKNRVSQYFQDTASHSPKTRQMVSKIDHFDVIVAASEFEALVLECSFIKQYLPKYNILLKDDKGYPYIRLQSKDDYPLPELVSRPQNDGANYYGPFGNRSITNQIIESICEILKLPKCKKVFPRDIGKERPCLNYHMNHCIGWCQPGKSYKEYRKRIEDVSCILSGNYRIVADEIRAQMLDAAERLDFELAAGLRDELNAVEALGQKQLVTAGNLFDTDVIGFSQTEAKSCFSILHFRNGDLVDKEYEIGNVYEDAEAAVSSLMKQYYLSRGFAPRQIFLPMQVEDSALFEELLSKELAVKTKIRFPKRGKNAHLVEMANKNAMDEATRATTSEERHRATVSLLGRMLMIDPPERIESYDISNISGTDIVASMVVYVDGKPKKSEYKKYKITGLNDQDDYASMNQVIFRRFSRYKAGEEGFSEKPDLVLIDGGAKQVQAAERAIESLDLKMSVFGMVKDDRHRTRALVTSDDRCIHIDSQQAVFSFIGAIQEETHRFAVSYHRQLRSKRLRYSELDKIPGVGPKRKQDLLKMFKSIGAIKSAELYELERCLPAGVAQNVYLYFKSQDKE